VEALSKIVELVKSGILPKSVSYSTTEDLMRFWSAVGSALQLATNGQASVQAALQEAADSMRKH